MKDDPARRSLKLFSRRFFEAELAIRRAWRRFRGEDRFLLGGRCEGCARCCEEPSIQVPKLMTRLPFSKALFLAWQEQVNGFSLKREELEGQVLVFECTHFDPQTRRCDSYESRPGICRDYPRTLLEQPWPEFFEGCGYRAVDRKGAELAQALEGTQLEGEALAELKRKLRTE